jgi:cytochrome c2
MPCFNMSENDAKTIANYISSSLQSPRVNPAALRESNFTPEMAAHGRQLFENVYKCQSCHTVGSSGGYVGPSLNDAGNWLTPAWVEAWLDNPQAVVPGAIEPRQPFTANEKRDLTAYLMTLKHNQEKEAPSANLAGGPQ